MDDIRIDCCICSRSFWVKERQIAVHGFPLPYHRDATGFHCVGSGYPAQVKERRMSMPEARSA